jgi:hypothetical protein
MYPGLMVRAGEVPTSPIHYFFSTYLMLPPRTHRRAQLRLTSASDFQGEIYECHVKIAFYNSQLEVLDYH